MVEPPKVNVLLDYFSFNTVIERNFYKIRFKIKTSEGKNPKTCEMFVK